MTGRGFSIFIFDTSILHFAPFWRLWDFKNTKFNKCCWLGTRVRKLMKNSCLSVIVYQQYFINSALLLYVYLSSNKQKPHDCIITKKCHCMVDSCSKHLLIYFDQDFVSPTHVVKLLALCLNSYYSPWAVFHQRTLQCLFLYNK